MPEAGTPVPSEVTNCQARTRAVPRPASQYEKGSLGPHGPTLTRLLALPPQGRVLWAHPAPLLLPSPGAFVLGLLRHSSTCAVSLLPVGRWARPSGWGAGWGPGRSSVGLGLAKGLSCVGFSVGCDLGGGVPTGALVGEQLQVRACSAPPPNPHGEQWSGGCRGSLGETAEPKPLTPAQVLWD